MTYKIAVASSDGIQVNETFGSTAGFLVYTIMEDKISTPEERVYVSESESMSCTPSNSCGNGNGCGNGVQNCGGNAGIAAKIALVGDCRCVVCRKIGFQVQKQLERKAISYFDVSCSITEALDKIIAYYRRVDRCQSLRQELP